MSALGKVSSAKEAAIRQWTADPCGPAVVAEPGTAQCIEQLIAGRHSYCAWLERALDYESARGLDVLDVGCRQGIDVVQYARAGARATGIDLTPRHVELARAHTSALGLDVTIVQGDAEQLPFPDASFDRVSSNGVLHDTPDMPAALHQVRRVLRPEGEARIIVYNRRSYHYWLSQVLWNGIIQRQLLHERSMEGVLSRGVEHTSIWARPLVRVYSRTQLTRMMRDAGFSNVSTSVGGFNAEDTLPTHVLASRTRLLDNPRALDFLARTGGWYVMGTGQLDG